MKKNSQDCPFWTCFLTKSTHSLLSAWSLLLVHIWFTPSQGPKGLTMQFLEVRPWKCDHGKMPSDMGQFHGP